MRSELHLVISKDHRPEGVYHLEDADVSIGRTTSNAICLPHDTVSRRHSVIVRAGNHFIIRDLGSRNGTRIDGLDVREAILRNSSVIEIGPYSLTACDDLESATRLAQEYDDSTKQHEKCNAEQLVLLESRLTQAQLRVYKSLMTGKSEKEVANRLCISVNTVHTHAKSIYAKFGVSSRPELIAFGNQQTR